ncbi:MAG: NAD-dependent epimerase/dehydratase family protein, partial [Candidatus Dormiibacterota bacterium]
MRVVVTGGAGFIGSHLTDRLLREGHEVAVVDDLSGGRREQVSDQARFYQLDVASEWLGRVVERERPEVVFHLAAQIDVRKSV